MYSYSFTVVSARNKKTQQITCLQTPPPLSPPPPPPPLDLQTLLAMLADPLAVDCEGRTPLDYASQLEDGAAMTTLLQAGPQGESLHQDSSDNSSEKFFHFVSS